MFGFTAPTRLFRARWLRIAMVAALMAWGYGAAVHALPLLSADAVAQAQKHCAAADHGDADETSHHDEGGACCDPTHCSAVAVLLVESADTASFSRQWTTASAGIPLSSSDSPAGPPPNA